MTPPHRDGCIQAVRRFNRFYTRKIGVLNEGVYRSPFSLIEVRILYELATRQKPTATELIRELGLDAGYLSRILRGFGKRGLIRKSLSPTDARQSHLSLTAGGHKNFASLDARSSEEVGALLAHLSAADQSRLVGAMATIELLLGPPQEPQDTSESTYLLRPHQPGDMGWVVQRHGALYAQEYGYDEHFEALVAEIVAKFIHHFDPKREHCWMAEKDGEIVGSVFLVKKSKKVAKLRLLLVEPRARGRGMGARLIAECIRFARQAGYRKITLWTQSELKAARHLYQRAGFSRAAKKRHRSFGQNLVAETWELNL
ncbi:MAG TPA: helix-turn-helix domain-containing GNAT family N-acetyltransferase [Terriglobia bacterium]|nr:helix-turn-helix domain-containing GNAT family N-acetyltransferase [Terriglobia bacterium]